MPSGFPSPTTICRRLVTKIVPPSAGASPSSITFCRFDSSADANTSAGAPSMIAVARLAEPSVVTCTSTPGWASSKAASTSSNAPLSDVAASTITVPSSSAPPRRGRGRLLVAAVGSSSSPQRGDEQDQRKEGDEGTGDAHGDTVVND